MDKIKELYDLYISMSSKSVIPIVACRHSGKTNYLIERALKQANEGKKVAIVSANTRTNKHVTVRTALDKIKDFSDVQWKQSEYTIYTKNGGSIILLDDTTIEQARGMLYDEVLFDGAGYNKNLEYQIKSVFRPMQIYNKAKIILIGSLTSSKNYFDKLLEDYQSISITADEFPQLAEYLKELPQDEKNKEYFMREFYNKRT